MSDPQPETEHPIRPSDEARRANPGWPPETAWWNTAPQPLEDGEALLREHMAQCRQAARFILTFLYDTDTTVSEGLAAAKAASELMALDLKLQAAVGDRGPREFVHRCIVEHRQTPHMIDVKPEAERPGLTPPPPAETRKQYDVAGRREGLKIE